MSLSETSETVFSEVSVTSEIARLTHEIEKKDREGKLKLEGGKDVTKYIIDVPVLD